MVVSYASVTTPEHAPFAGTDFLMGPQSTPTSGDAAYNLVRAAFSFKLHMHGPWPPLQIQVWVNLASPCCNLAISSPSPG